MMDEITKKIHSIIAEQALIDVEDVKPESTPQALGLDSLAMVEIVFAVEEAFNITVPFNANDPSASEFDISNVQAITDAVRNLIAKQKV
jgi:acyl carrier protein